MTILKDISIIWSLLHTLVMFWFLFESRYSRKKTVALTLITMLPLIVANSILFLIMEPEAYLALMLLTCSLPSLVFFWFLAKNRDGRFLFTFCLVDTIALEILSVTNIINHFISGDTYIFLFVSRLVIFPVLEWIIYKKLRPVYLDVQQYVKKGWYTFAAIGAIFYLTITLSISYPTMITERLEYLPALILQLLLMPALYIHILSTLQHQQHMHKMQEQEDIMRLQVSNMAVRMEEYAAADEKFRMERHNFRHKMQAIATMVEQKEYDELRNLVLEYNEAIKETQIKRYCVNAVIDAVLSSYLQKAEERGIRVTTKIAFPNPITVGEAELATVFANAIENAIHACEKVEEKERFLDVKVLTVPRFMIQISNSFDGEVEFDKNEIPLSTHEGHGFGTRSIAAFCEKNNAFYEFKADDEVFALRIVFG